MNIQATRIFWENSLPRKCKEAGYPFGSKGTDRKINVNMGGGGSGKSHSIMQVMMNKFFSEEKKNFLIVRKTLPSLKLTTWRIFFYKVLEEFGMRETELNSQKTMMNYFHGIPSKQNFLHFGGLDDPEKIKSSEWNYIWVEEATEFSLSDFQTLLLYLRNESRDGKPNQIFLSFNPISEFHWLKTELVDKDYYANKKVIRSTYKDNPFLPKESVRDYENLITQNKNLHRIYALGEWGVLEDAVYSNFYDAQSFPKSEDISETIYGLDFGWNVPTALLQIDISNKEENTCWERELIYQTEMKTPEIIKEMEKLIPENMRNCPIYCDSADPEKIDQIAAAGFPGAVPMFKGPKSVKPSIELVQLWRTYICPGSDNLRKEKHNYSWRKNSRGERTDDPVKWMDHLMDAEKGALYTHFQGAGEINVTFF